MKTNIQIKNHVYEALNVFDVTNFINGNLYNGGRPAKERLDEDIIVGALPVNSEFVQSATVNVNCFARDPNEDVPNFERLQEIFAVVKTALDDYSTTEYFDMSIASQEIMDAEAKGWSYLNLRIICKILKD